VVSEWSSEICFSLSCFVVVRGAHINVRTNINRKVFICNFFFVVPEMKNIVKWSLNDTLLS